MRLSLLLCLAAALLACSDPAARLRQHTYPPDFDYLEEGRIESAMWTLAWEVVRLEQVLRDRAPDDPRLKGKVGVILQRMERAADDLDTPGRHSQHPLLNRHLPRFRERLRWARIEAERTPPNFLAAAALSGSCSACHDQGEG